MKSISPGALGEDYWLNRGFGYILIRRDLWANANLNALIAGQNPCQKYKNLTDDRSSQHRIGHSLLFPQTGVILKAGYIEIRIFIGCAVNPPALAVVIHRAGAAAQV